jgi:hypothetical protein
MNNQFNDEQISKAKKEKKWYVLGRSQELTLFCS